MTISYTQARDALVTRVNTVLTTYLPGLKAYYENTVKVDINSVGDQFIQVEVSFEESQMATVDDSLVDAVYGFVGFRLFIKEGAGSRSAQSVFDTLNTHLRHQTLSGVRTYSAAFGRKETKDGWTAHEIGFPFHYYSSN